MHTVSVLQVLQVIFRHINVKLKDLLNEQLSPMIMTQLNPGIKVAKQYFDNRLKRFVFTLSFL